MLDGSGFKAMSGLIAAPNYGSLWKIRKIQVANWGTPKENMEYKTSSRSYRTFFFADEEFYRFFLLLSKDILLQMIFIYVTNMQALLQKIGQKKKFYRICYRASFSRV